MKIALALSSIILLAGCGSGTEGSVSAEPTAGTNRPASAAPVAEPEPVETEAPQPTEAAFGEAYTFENGLQVTVSKPVPYKPSETAAFEPMPAYVIMDVVVVNGTQERFDPSVISMSMQSANTEGDPIYDGDIGGSPSTLVLPGRETKFRTAWGVADVADLVFQFTPGFEYEPAIFTS